MAAHTTARFRRWETTIQVAAGTTLLLGLFGLSEFVCGRYVDAWDKQRPPAIPGTDDAQSERARRFSRDNPVPLVRDTTVLWRNMPGAERTQPVNPRADEHPAAWTLRNSSEGFRGDERPFKGSDDVYRILCVGDSVTFGFNVDQDEPFARRLEAEIARRHPGARIEVINAGVIGWSWVQGVRFVERYGLPLHPSVIIAGHGANDQYWNVHTTDREHMWELESPIARGREALADLLAVSATYRALLAVFPPAQAAPDLSPACEVQSWQTGACHRVALPEIEATVHHLAHLAADNGIDLIVWNSDFVETPAVQAVRRAAQRDGLIFLDEVQHVAALRLAAEFSRARELHLAPAHLPTLPRQLVDERTQARRGARLLFRVQVASTAEHVSISGAWGVRGDATFDEPMYDDGTHGDEIANDHVFSVVLEAPPNEGTVRYLFTHDGTPEFVPLPPYTPLWAARHARFGDDGISFIERFGERFMMVERAHPDPAGHAVIATDLLKQIEALPSFGRFLGTGSAAS